MRFVRHTLCLSLAALLPTCAFALSNAELSAIVSKRLDGDRTGACFAVAVIEKTVAQTVVCADQKHPRPWNADTAFEIGSVSKTMSGALLASLIADGKLGLDDPISQHLPRGTKVPSFEGKPITLRHLSSHTSGLPGLPSRMQPGNPANPYADLTEGQLLASLAEVQLDVEPGKRWDYSNFGGMLLSYILGRAAGDGFETLISERLFQPLQMQAFVSNAGPGVDRAQGHLPGGTQTSAWDIPAALAGVGGVRASLNDMIHYVEAHLDRSQSSITPALLSSQKEISSSGRRMGMGWIMAPLNGRVVHVHEGGTGGFSSLVAFDRELDRGVIILSDTAMTSVGGLGSLGMHLMDSAVPLGEPRTAMPARPELIDALVGEYELSGGMRMTLRRKGDALEIQAQGQPAFVMGFDSAGDFYPLAFDALLKPQDQGAGGMSFVWLQGGGSMAAKRLGTTPDNPPTTLSIEQLQDYVGEFPLAPEFVMTVFIDRGKLFVRATGQGALTLEAAESDVFRAPQANAEIRFERDKKQQVNALILVQGGHQQRAPKR